MAVETERGWQDSGEVAERPRHWLGAIRRIGRFFADHAFSSVARRIAILNLAGLVAMVSAILYLNQFREGLIDARVESLLTQGEIIAGAISASATNEPGRVRIDPESLLQLDPGQTMAPTEQDLGWLEFPINPERVAPILRRLISPTRTRARIYDREGYLILDSRNIVSRGQILRYELSSPEPEAGPGTVTRVWRDLQVWMRRGEHALYEEHGPAEGRRYSEVEAALNGASASVVRVNEKGELIVSVAIPIQRFRAVLGGLMLSTQGGDIDAIVNAERMGILRIFLVAAAVTLVLSILLAGTIAGPIHRLAGAAERVRHGTKARAEIPNFADRHDEIGHLSRALRDMTKALYDRIEAIETFAADVAHELKNPLTSLRSAAETLPLAKNKADRERLTAILRHDVERLNRLITDISDASRLDAELARADNEPVDILQLLDTVTSVARELHQEGAPSLELDVAPSESAEAYFVLGNDMRLGQVVNNLLDNARSFTPPEGQIVVRARRLKQEVEIAVEDEGPGIPPDAAQRIFNRFYTDRGENGDFGNHSGLGLSISRQIVEAHGGRIWVENRMASARDDGSQPKVLGARFVVRLPAAA